MAYQLIPQGSYLHSTWSGGETHQIAIAPKGAVYAERNFLWRVSIATVDLEESDFTALPDYRRYSAVLEGGMQVSHDGRPYKELKPYEPHAFDGGAKTHAKGKCRDFNLMLRKGQCEGSLKALHFRGETPLQAEDVDTQLLFAAKGAFTWRSGTDTITVDEGACLLVEGREAQSFEIASEEGSILLLARITNL